MKTTLRTHRLLVLLLAAFIGAGQALAAPPPWAGGGKNGGGDKEEKARPQERKEKKARDDRGDLRVRSDDRGGKGQKQARKAPQPGAYFDDRNRAAVAKYYATPRKSCPPGLAKKNNGCMPPGQAKKWQVGQPLPAGVAVYPVPQQILVTLPPVPVGHRYVQVAGDILLVTVGSMMVVDGINGLLR